MLAEVSSISQIFESVDDHQSEQLFFALEHGMFAIQKIEGLSLAVLGDHTLNPAMLRVGCSVLSSLLRKKRAYKDRNNQREQPQPQATSQPQPQGRNSSVGTDPDITIHPKIVHSLTMKFGRYIGPAARVVIRKRCAKMGVTPQTLTIAHWKPLVRQLSEKIANRIQRGQFKSEAYDLVC